MADSKPLAVVAIDGPAGAGKSSVARAVAERLGLPYIDTGAMYRAATWAVLRAGALDGSDSAITDAALGAQITVDEGGAAEVDGVDVTEAIRGPEVTGAVSRVSALPGVRAGLVPLQRNLAARGGVLEGRDIGTVVFPGAPVKVFLTASVAERARRRGLQLGGEDEEALMDALEQRDRADSTRDVSPLRPADDAEVIDTSQMSEAEVVEAVVDLCEQRGVRSAT